MREGYHLLLRLMMMASCCQRYCRYCYDILSGYHYSIVDGEYYSIADILQERYGVDYATERGASDMVAAA